MHSHLYPKEQVQNKDISDWFETEVNYNPIGSRCRCREEEQIKVVYN
jgi:hypothetical protein